MGGTVKKAVKRAAKSVGLGSSGGGGGTPPPTTKETREEIKDKFEAPKTTDAKDKELDARKLTRRASRRRRTGSLIGGQLAGGLTGTDYSPVRNPRDRSTLG